MKPILSMVLISLAVILTRTQRSSSGHVDALVLQIRFELAFDGVEGFAARVAEEWFDAGDFTFAGHDVAP